MDIIVTERALRVVTVAPRGRIDAFSAPELREQVDILIEDGAHHFVLDLTNVPFLDSAGLAVLVSVLKRSRLQGGNVRLVLPTDEAARRILHLTKFDRVFDIADSADAALASYLR